MPVRFFEAPALPRFLARELPFRRRMADADGTHVHFIDQGEGPAVLLMHGNPTWSYLWRKVVRRLDGKVRCIVPDLVGFGLSDKPTRVGEYGLEMEIDVMTKLVDALDLGPLVLVGQDWGGPIVTGVGHRAPGRVRGMVLANTSVITPARPFRPKAFHRFAHKPVVSDLAFRVGAFPIPVLDRTQGDPRSIGLAGKRAYFWPLRRPWERAAPLALARMVPTSESHPSTAPLDAIGAWVESYEGPVELVWGRKDPILGRALRRHAEALPRARVTETDAGHFLQEEVPEALSDAILRVAS
jgi:haloalkane dehalogenase